MINEWQIDFNAKVIVSQEDIDDILCTAFEGGITYWCDRARVDGDYRGTYASEQVSRGGGVFLHDFEENEEIYLNMDNFLIGLHKYLETDSKILVYSDGSLVIDTCQVDADVADQIVQFAIFGEVIYG